MAVRFLYASQSSFGGIKKTYDEVTEDIFDMSAVRLFKEIEKKKMGDVYFVMSPVS